MQIDKKKFSNLMKGLQAAYPNAKFVDTEAGLEMWYTMLSDLPLENLVAAVQKHISTNKYAPTIAEIREIASNPAPVKDWSEGWGYVLSAVSQFGSYRADEALDYIYEMDPLSYKVLKRLNFKEICMSEDLTVDRANFRMAYENEKKYERENNAVPLQVKQVLERLSENKSLNKALENTNALEVEQ